MIEAHPADHLPINQTITQEEEKGFSASLIFKIIYIIGFIALFLALTVFLTKKYLVKKTTSSNPQVLMEFPYQLVLWRDFGQVFEPIVKIPLYFPDKGYQNQEFLLDSGAVVSSLPREMATEMGFSLAQLPRSTFSGFGGTTSFAYKGDAKLLLGSTEVNIPVVFTESTGTKSILGRSGFFETFSIYFNSDEEKIEIRK